jgi:hypothetical protein
MRITIGHCALRALADQAPHSAIRCSQRPSTCLSSARDIRQPSRGTSHPGAVISPHNGPIGVFFQTRHRRRPTPSRLRRVSCDLHSCRARTTPIAHDTRPCPCNMPSRSSCAFAKPRSTERRQEFRPTPSIFACSFGVGALACLVAKNGIDGQGSVGPLVRGLNSPMGVS